MGMKFERLLDLIGEQGWFEFATLVQLAEERRSSLQVQLHRWCKAGKLLPLRRGMYALAERYRRKQVSPADLANHLYAPSYLSLHWALSYYGLIPELVQQHTSVTRRKPAHFENDFGTFVYRNIKADAFFGYHSLVIAGASVQVAHPEKALLDLWHLEKGAWTPVRMEAMRFQGVDRVRPARLEAYASRFRSPRLEAVVQVWQDWCEEQDEGEEL